MSERVEFEAWAPLNSQGLCVYGAADLATDYEIGSDTEGFVRVRVIVEIIEPDAGGENGHD